jgi:hypothetical protein
MEIGISAILPKAIERCHSMALAALLLLGYGCAESERSADKIYARTARSTGNASRAAKAQLPNDYDHLQR